jgi:DNA-binding CsgD family transcriptional regulator
VAGLESAGLDGTRLRAERVQTLAFTGRPTDAVVGADELLERPTPFLLHAWVMGQRVEALTHLGRFADAEETLRQVEPMLTDEWMSRGESLVAAADLAYWSGRPRDAAALAGQALAMPTNYEGNYLLPALTRAWAQADLGLPLEPLPGAPDSWAHRGALAEWSALDTFASGSPAVGAFDEAADLWASHHVLRSAVCRWAAGEAARRAGASDAVERLRQALEVAGERGFEPLAARVRRSLRLSGVRLPRAPVRESGGGLLTGREHEVLDLVALGQSNIEIARRMGLGRPTVARILSNAMAKLGAESRAQAVTHLRRAQ